MDRDKNKRTGIFKYPSNTEMNKSFYANSIDTDLYVTSHKPREPREQREQREPRGSDRRQIIHTLATSTGTGTDTGTVKVQNVPVLSATYMQPAQEAEIEKRKKERKKLVKERRRSQDISAAGTYIPDKYLPQSELVTYTDYYVHLDSKNRNPRAYASSSYFRIYLNRVTQHTMSNREYLNPPLRIPSGSIISVELISLTIPDYPNGGGGTTGFTDPYIFVAFDEFDGDIYASMENYSKPVFAKCDFDARGGSTNPIFIQMMENGGVKKNFARNQSVSFDHLTMRVLHYSGSNYNFGNDALTISSTSGSPGTTITFTLSAVHNMTNGTTERVFIVGHSGSSDDGYMNRHLGHTASYNSGTHSTSQFAITFDRSITIGATLGYMLFEKRQVEALIKITALNGVPPR